MSRRCQIIKVDDRAIAHLFSGSLGGFPEDCEIRSVEHDFIRQSFLLIVEHPDFPEVEEGQELPIMDLPSLFNRNDRLRDYLHKKFLSNLSENEFDAYLVENEL